MNKKRIIILSSIAAVLIIMSLLVFFLRSNKSNDFKNGGKDKETIENFTPEFLSVEEKKKLGIPADKKIQALSRDENGELTVYKVIKNDSDVAIPSRLKQK